MREEWKKKSRGGRVLTEEGDCEKGCKKKNTVEVRKKKSRGRRSSGLGREGKET